MRARGKRERAQNAQCPTSHTWLWPPLECGNDRKIFTPNALDVTSISLAAHHKNTCDDRARMDNSTTLAQVSSKKHCSNIIPLCFGRSDLMAMAHSNFYSTPITDTHAYAHTHTPATPYTLSVLARYIHTCKMGVIGILPWA